MKQMYRKNAALFYVKQCCCQKTFSIRDNDLDENIPVGQEKALTLTWTLRLHVRRQPSLGRRQCETKTIIEWNKTVQNHHSTAFTTADPVRAFANHPIV